MAKIAFIGLGSMGGPMASNLARAGHEVKGFDLSPFLCKKAAMTGVEVTTTARETMRADTVITMLPGGEQVLSVWKDLLPLAAKDTLFIDCSTIDIDSCRQAHQAAFGLGLQSLDAPVSGGVAGAEAGTLTFMCGGEESCFIAAKPILEKMGKTVLHCGGAGLGQAAKICNNMILGASMIVTCEAFVLAEKLGLSDRALFDAVSVSSGQCWSLTSYCPAPGLTPTSPANNGYRAGFMAALMLKDLRLAQHAAARAGATTPLGAMAEQLYGIYAGSGRGEVDFSGIIEMIRGGKSDR